MNVTSQLPDLTTDEYRAALTDHGFIAVPMQGFVALPNGTCVNEQEGGATNRERLAYLLEKKENNPRRTPQEVWTGSVAGVASAPAMLPGSLTSRSLLALVGASPLSLVQAKTMDFEGQSEQATREDILTRAQNAQRAYWDAVRDLEQALNIQLDGQDLSHFDVASLLEIFGD